METGTLKELNVKPGDVVEVLNNASRWWTPGKHYEVNDLLQIIDDDGDERDYTEPFVEARIISRAAQPTSDLTAITTPFGLLDEATQEALLAHGGPYEYWYQGEWIEGPNVGNLNCWAWRVKPGPIIKTIRVTITNDEEDGSVIAEANVTIRNGKPDWSTLQVRND